MPSRFDNLRGGARGRLANYRAKAAKSLATIRANHSPESAALLLAAGYATWQRQRYITPSGLGFNAPAGGFRASDDGKVWYADSGALDHLRTKDAADVLREAGRHYAAKETRWYCDADQSETIDAHVCQLPARGGREQWLAYITWSDADGIVINRTIHDSAEDAATDAAETARIYAEREREYSERWNAARELDEKEADALDHLRLARAAWHVALRGWIDAKAHGADVAAATCFDAMERHGGRFADAMEDVRSVRAELEQFADVER
jgi:hypothetical protein